MQSPARQASQESLGLVKPNSINSHTRNVSQTLALGASPSNANIVKPKMPGTLLKSNSNASLRGISPSPTGFMKNASMAALDFKGKSLGKEGSVVRASQNFGPTTASMHSPSKTLLHGQGS